MRGRRGGVKAPAKPRKRKGEGEQRSVDGESDGDNAGKRRGSKRGRKPKKQPRVSNKEALDEPGSALLSAEEVREKASCPPQNYFQVKEGNGVGRKAINKITDLIIVEEEELREALTKLTPKHVAEQAALMESYQDFYRKWHFQLSCGFGLLLYGFGSKKSLLEDFANSALMDGAAIVVSGYLPNINIKHVLFTIASTLWESKKKKAPAKVQKSEGPLSTSSVEDLLAFLNHDEESAHIYVIVHNIDGPGVRDDDVQRTLASVAASRNVRFAASIDNVNAPILWDKQMARNQFKWLWLHTPTYAAYTVEGTYVPLVFSATGAAESARSAALVLQSLTPNAQSVFRVLAEFQVAHPDDQGLPLHQLYRVCREQFLVSNEVTLRAHLTEFKDHDLLRFRRALDGQDCLYIPLPAEALTKLLQEINN